MNTDVGSILVNPADEELVFQGAYLWFAFFVCFNFCQKKRKHCSQYCYLTALFPFQTIFSRLVVTDSTLAVCVCFDKDPGNTCWNNQ